MVRLGKQHHSFLGNHGQSTVEYILLLAVVISLIYVVINSPLFKNLLGEGGSFAVKMKASTEWNYRFGSQGNEEFSAFVFPGGRHPTYWNATRSTTHFIGPKDPYPVP